jgi:hypothetical protein
VSSAELEVYEPQTALIRPAGNIAEIEQAFRDYQELCTRLLDKTDYQSYMQWNPETKRKEPRQFRKRSAWRKLATAMGVTFEIVSHTRERDDHGHTVSAEFIVRATAPNGRFADGWGNCDCHERCKDACPEGCKGFTHFSKPHHDIPATAETRAKNRAAADLFGMGEVSAEEMAGAERAPERIEEAEIVTSPTGDVFPDQRDEPGQFMPPAGAADPNKITPKQLSLIKVLVGKAVKNGVPEEMLREQLQLNYGTSHFSELTKAEATKVIPELKLSAGETA